MKATEQCFHAVLFTIFAVLGGSNFSLLMKPWCMCDHSNESRTVLLCDTVYSVVQGDCKWVGGSNFFRMSMKPNLRALKGKI